ncbi:hypothetical protein GF407_04090 [candidate division KSB1 bacterium]|nr:hypothetical protein [candidate division KSB1 bacterium]
MTFKNMKLALIFLVCCFMTTLSRSQVSLNGYYKNFFTVIKPVQSPLFPVPEDDYLGMVNKRLRLESRVSVSGKLSLHLAYDFSLGIQDQRLSFDIMDFLPKDQYRFADIDARIYPQESKASSFRMRQNLDRVYLHYRARVADVYVGRQVISWGSARVINPTDILLPFMFNELDKEERTGVDALRIRIPLGMMSEVDIGYIAGKDFNSNQSAAYLRSKFYAFQSDVSLLTLFYYDHFLAGLNFARAVGGAGVWLEAAYSVNNLSENDASSGNNYMRLSVGTDYSLREKLYGFIEYHYNGAGSHQSHDYMKNFISPAYLQGGVYLLGKHYLMPGFQYQLKPLILLSGQVLFNLSDRSAYYTPVVEYNIAPNIYIGGGAYIGAGKSPETFTLHSEFGTWPDFFYSSFRVYF